MSLPQLLSAILRIHPLPPPTLNPSQITYTATPLTEKMGSGSESSRCLTPFFPDTEFVASPCGPWHSLPLCAAPYFGLFPSVAKKSSVVCATLRLLFYPIRSPSS